MDIRIGHEFGSSAACEGLLSFEDGFDCLMSRVRTLDKTYPNVNHAEPLVRQAFIDFLKSQNYLFALKNFEALLNEKRGDKFLRNDGTINWYHEFIPILAFMDLARMGYDRGGFDLKALEKHGRMEVSICSHLRHDSVEDFSKRYPNRAAFRDSLEKMIAEISTENFGYDIGYGHNQMQQIVINNNLISQKKIAAADGTVKKESVIRYTENLVFAEDANPAVFILKQLDTNHNQGTMRGSEKFTLERILKRCNDREDMYGSRMGLTNWAKRKWPEFARAIDTCDGQMGFTLFPQFRLLSDVDLFYKEPAATPVNVDNYIEGQLRFTAPPQFNSGDIFLNRMRNFVDPEREPEKYARLQDFLQNKMAPALDQHKNRFPAFFPELPKPNPPRLVAM